MGPANAHRVSLQTNIHLVVAIDLFQIHGKPWYPMSCTFLSLKTVKFYSKAHGLLPQDFNLGQI